jgi:hypothetical protein
MTDGQFDQRARDARLLFMKHNKMQYMQHDR